VAMVNERRAGRMEEKEWRRAITGFIGSDTGWFFCSHVRVCLHVISRYAFMGVYLQHFLFCVNRDRPLLPPGPLSIVPRLLVHMDHRKTCEKQGIIPFYCGSV
jgi:hypothetical protein